MRSLHRYLSPSFSASLEISPSMCLSFFVSNDAYSDAFHSFCSSESPSISWCLSPPSFVLNLSCFVSSSTFFLGPPFRGVALSIFDSSRFASWACYFVDAFFFLSMSCCLSFVLSRSSISSFFHHYHVGNMWVLKYIFTDGRERKLARDVPLTERAMEKKVEWKRRRRPSMKGVHTPVD